MQKWLFILLVMFCVSVHSYEQPQKADGTIHFAQELPSKFFSSVDKKTDKHKNQVSTKTDKTFIKPICCKREMHGLLLNANPTLSSRLLSKKDLTLARKHPNKIVVQFPSPHTYTCELTTSI